MALSPDRYEGLTNNEFDRILAAILDETYNRPSQMLTLPRLYEDIAEYFNNDVLDRWERKQAEKSDDTE